MKDVEDALQRLDKLTQEEARMAAAETLTITSRIDDTVKEVDERLEGVDETVQSVDVKVDGIDDKVLSVDSKVQGVDKKIQSVDDKVLSVDSKVQGVDRKVSSVYQGELLPFTGPRIGPQFFPSLGVMETGVTIQQVSNQVNDLNCS
jgi:archaellum component FlaC